MSPPSSPSASRVIPEWAPEQAAGLRPLTNSCVEVSEFESTNPTSNRSLQMADRDVSHGKSIGLTANSGLVRLDSFCAGTLARRDRNPNEMVATAA